MLRPRKRLVIWLTRKAWYKLSALVLMLGFVGWAFMQDTPHAAETWSSWSLPLSGKVIGIDAGHGGPDGGAVSRTGLIEKEINLSISLYLRDYLQQAGAVVVLTREQDEDLAEPGMQGLKRRKTADLLRRAALLEEKHADLLLSIHMNSDPVSAYKGAQAFYDPNQNKDNERLASLVQEQLKLGLMNTTRAANTVSTIYLLKAMQIPAVLVEVGFLSNTTEARLLADTGYQQKVAAAIYTGILRYASEMEKITK